MDLQRLKEIKDLRKIWPHEAHDFTPWLAKDENIEILSEALGLDISVNETESDVGDFNVDILATESGSGKKIIIENQLEDTNHDHLGKLITYASGKGADIVIWLVKHAREEHRSAVEWLNNHTDDDISFFLCEIKLYQIGNSEPAVKFDVIEKPNDWSRSLKASEGLTERDKTLLTFWQHFADYAYEKPEFSENFTKRKAQPQHWFSLGSGNPNCSIDLTARTQKKFLGVEIYVRNNKDLFYQYQEHKEEIESIIGCKVEWIEANKDCRILVTMKADINTNEDNWSKYFDWYCEHAIQMLEIVRKFGNS